MSANASARNYAAHQAIIPLLQPKWKRSVTSTDTEPTLIQQQEDHNEVCQVCRQCESRYKCPRCQLPYCSVACYKEHNTDGTSCTEAFYQDRVATVLHYEAKEQTKSIQQILTRSHQQTLAGEEDCDQENDENDVSEQDLWRLAEALENGMVTDEDEIGRAHV